MLKHALIIISVLGSFSAVANYNLAKNGKSVVCYADDNIAFVLNAKRTTVKWSSEGESLGPKKIKKVNTDNESFVSYTTVEGKLTLSDKDDTFQFADSDEVFSVRCR